MSVSNGGCDEFVHHFETVVGAHPNYLDSQRLVFFFSANITFRRLRSLLFVIAVRIIICHKDTHFILYKRIKLRKSGEN